MKHRSNAPSHSLLADASFATQRRHLLMSGAALAVAGWGSPCSARALTADTLVLGQSVALSGPLADLGQAMHQGARAAFLEVNAKGGVSGRRIELLARDDGYELARAIENYKVLLANPGVFALFNCMGTPMNEALLPLIRNTGIPYFAPFTGATSARPADMRNVFNIRASYPDETRRLVEHLATVAIQRIAVAYQNNSFGKEVMEGAERAMRQHQLEAVQRATVENNGMDAEAAAASIVAARPQAVLIGLAGKPAVNFVRAMRRLGAGIPLYTLSVMGTSATLNALGEDAIGLVVSQVVPMPNNAAMPVVREFLRAWQALGTTSEPSHIALEGYINARVFAEALWNAGAPLGRSRFIDAVWSLKRLNIGGFELGFAQPGTSASKFVELTMVRQGGKFIR